MVENGAVARFQSLSNQYPSQDNVAEKRAWPAILIVLPVLHRRRDKWYQTPKSVRAYPSAQHPALWASLALNLFDFH